MKIKLFIGALSILSLLGCASAPKSGKPERNFNATSLTVDLSSNSREVLEAIPAESLMDRFEMLDAQGRIVSYVAFTDTETGALVFVDQKLYGTLSRRDAQAFYSCRGYTTTTAHSYWANEAAKWLDSLLANTKPATRVELEFSGKTTTQSIKDAAGNSAFSRIRSLFGMGTNPLSIISTLNTARNDFTANAEYEIAVQGMKTLKPGMSELRVAEVAKPEEVSFVNNGFVMAYPSHFVEYFVAGGVIQVIQQPPLLSLAKTRAAMFYAPGTEWSRCTPSRWTEALLAPPAPANVVMAAQ